MPPAKRVIRSVDATTGELLDGVPVLIPARIPSPYGDRWMQLNQDPLLEIAKDKGITVNVYRVFVYLNAILDFENYIYTSPSLIAKELGIHRPNVSAALRVLEAKKILLIGPRVGQAPTYRLNPLYGWKGKIHHLRQHLSSDRTKQTHKTGDISN